jgi:hypothetical protein
MKLCRKIQLGAGTLILCGATALGLLPDAALATTCQTSIGGCSKAFACPTGVDAYCASLQPGCTVTNASCAIVPDACPWPGAGYLFACDYS